MIDNCVAFDEITVSRKDTTETKRQVLIHNKTYQRICKENEK